MLHSLRIDPQVSVLFWGFCNDPPRRYSIHTLIFDNFNFYKKNSLNFFIMKIEVILSQHKFIQEHAIT